MAVPAVAAIVAAIMAAIAVATIINITVRITIHISIIINIIIATSFGTNMQRSKAVLIKAFRYCSKKRIFCFTVLGALHKLRVTCIFMVP